MPSTEASATRPKESGSAKLAGLMQMVKRDRAEKHFQAGMVAADKKEWKEAVEELERARDLFHEMGEAYREASVLSSLSLCHFALGELDSSEQEGIEAAEHMREAEDAEGEATAILGLGYVYLGKGDLETAQQTFFRAFSMFRSQDNWDGVMRSHLGLEKVALKRGSKKEAAKERELAEQARRRLVNSL